MKSLKQRKLAREERRRKAEHKEVRWHTFASSVFDVLIVLSEGLIRLIIMGVKGVIKMID
ncbi:hypothetical protein WQ57_17360 [Mesobacillus campisalis]|uniref:Uncharacterized protein n=1 Tax=Mesobacillus campisalis TaxID=1408103 RepID=A0A0M2ST16_9BACI|nr:hypothetical protein [Mesobacillus campisalis]KKK36826.1 hypothetical protein WQ57_17360 [Mesobacillus campisalis]